MKNKINRLISYITIIAILWVANYSLVSAVNEENANTSASTIVSSNAVDTSASTTAESNASNVLSNGNAADLAINDNSMPDSEELLSILTENQKAEILSSGIDLNGEVKTVDLNFGEDKTVNPNYGEDKTVNPNYGEDKTVHLNFGAEDNAVEYDVYELNIDRNSTQYKSMFNAVENKKTYVYTMDFNLTTEQIIEILVDIVYTNPRFFWAQVYFEYRATAKNGEEYPWFISLKYISFDLTQQELDANFDAEVNNILSGMNQENMTDVEKALYVHEYMATHYIYDFDIYDEDGNFVSSSQNSEVTYNAYGLAVDKIGVCQASTLFFDYMMSMMEPPIESSYVLSTAMNHAWNSVKIDGEWYYVDNTWDNSNRTISKNLHTYFLISKETLDKSHSEYTPIYETGNAFDEFFCRSISQSVSYHDGYWYYPDAVSRYIMRYSFETGITEQVAKISTFSYTSVAVLGDYLYYNTANDQIHRVNLDGTGDVLIYDLYEYDAFEGKIYGLMEEYGKIVFTVKSSPTADDVYYELVFDNVGNVADVVSASRDIADKAEELPNVVITTVPTTVPTTMPTTMSTTMAMTTSLMPATLPTTAMAQTTSLLEITTRTTPITTTTEFSWLSGDGTSNVTENPGEPVNTGSSGESGSSNIPEVPNMSIPVTEKGDNDTTTSYDDSGGVPDSVTTPTEYQKASEKTFVLADYVSLKKFLYGESVELDSMTVYDVDSNDVLNVIDLNLVLYYLLYSNPVVIRSQI